MTELDKMIRAEQYIRKMAEGINPITDEYVDEQDMINNTRLVRCLYYVSDILRKVIDNNGEISSTKNNSHKKAYFFLTNEQKGELKTHDNPIYAKVIAEKLNEYAVINECRKFSVRWITEYLISIGMLEMFEGNKRATESGEELGIISKKRYSNYEPEGYWANLYNCDAQQFIFDNLDAIIEFSKSDEYKEQIKSYRSKSNTAHN